MYKEILRSTEGIAIAPTISFLIFVLFFSDAFSARFQIEQILFGNNEKYSFRK